MFISILSILFLGILYAALFITGKKYLLTNHNIFLDLLFNGLRFLLLICVFFYIIKFIEINPILLITLFVSSYLSTIAIVTYKN